MVIGVNVFLKLESGFQSGVKNSHGWDQGTEPAQQGCCVVRSKALGSTGTRKEFEWDGSSGVLQTCFPFILPGFCANQGPPFCEPLS